MGVLQAAGRPMRPKAVSVAIGTKVSNVGVVKQPLVFSSTASSDGGTVGAGSIGGPLFRRADYDTADASLMRPPPSPTRPTPSHLTARPHSRENRESRDVHLHIFPRFAGDPFRMEADWRVQERAQLDRAAAAVRGGLAALDAG
ncbi:hypothetical protein [Streptomyces rimosus]|uniref:hypothetical protein n=1 Tax=Streptomyces rimosus TaxID=1927 RepID=UPI0037D1D7EF